VKRGSISVNSGYVLSDPRAHDSVVSHALCSTSRAELVTVGTHNTTHCRCVRECACTAHVHFLAVDWAWGHKCRWYGESSQAVQAKITAICQTTSTTKAVLLLKRSPVPWVRPTCRQEELNMMCVRRWSKAVEMAACRWVQHSQERACKLGYEVEITLPTRRTRPAMWLERGARYGLGMPTVAPSTAEEVFCRARSIRTDSDFCKWRWWGSRVSLHHIWW
jgi:hypothetical protein